MTPRTISVDFDGVIHSYINPYNDYQLDPPTEGAIKFLSEMTDIFSLEICSTRAKDQHGRDTIRRWLATNGLPQGKIDGIVVTNLKGMAIVYIDDRAYRFEGIWPTAQELFDLAQTWYKR